MRHSKGPVRRKWCDREVATYFGDVRNGDKLKLASVVFEGLLEVGYRGLATNGAADRVPLAEESLYDPDGNVAVSTGDEYFSSCDSWHMGWY